MKVINKATEHLARRARATRDARDLEILNAAAVVLNREMEDVLRYQARGLNPAP